MKLSKIYSNFPDKFAPVVFSPGLNVILAEIRLPQNKARDTHNLGKTTLGRLLDFMLLAGREPDFFLFKHEDLFSHFVFYLEIEIADSSYVTIRRSVTEASKISFKRHTIGNQDFSNEADSGWSHLDLPFERAKEMLDSILDWRVLKHWTFRKVSGYLLRSQNDYKEVFQLQKFASKHSDWKPFLAHLLGFDGTLVQEHYQKVEDLAEKKATEQTISNENGGGSVRDISKIEGLMLLKQKDADKMRAQLDAFDFRFEDKARIKELVETTDTRISELNTERYSLTLALKKVITSLQEDQVIFDPDEAEKLFKEAGVLFEGQLKKDFEQLKAFNIAITEERRIYLEEERKETSARITIISAELNNLGKQRAEALAFLGSTDVLAKYKQVSKDLVSLQADILSLERQRTSLQRLQELRTTIRLLEAEKQVLQSRIESNVEGQSADSKSLFSAIRSHFSDIVETVISRKALLSVFPNKEGNLEFKVEILDESGHSTSADSGYTYRKLLCVAFDLAVLRAHMNGKSPRFVYHDGVFESLDRRKKENLIEVLRNYADLGLQPIMTTIDSDLPNQPFFKDSEVIVRLHDEGDSGRLFKMGAW